MVEKNNKAKLDDSYIECARCGSPTPKGLAVAEQNKRNPQYVRLICRPCNIRLESEREEEDDPTGGDLDELEDEFEDES